MQLKPEPEPEPASEAETGAGEVQGAHPLRSESLSSPSILPGAAAVDATATRRQFDEARRSLLETVVPSQEPLLAAENTHGVASPGPLGASISRAATTSVLNTATVLISMDADGKLTIPDRALVMLREIEEDVAVVAIAGAARGGKSFMANCLAVPRDQPVEGPPPVRFAVGPNVTPCTKGLWAWLSPESVEVADGRRMRVLFVDSEGLGAIKSAEQKDMNILALSLLISSTFIFNSTGAIDERSIGKLAFVTKLSRHVHINLDGCDDAADFERNFPSFLWVLRDFSLTLHDAKGNSLSEKEYLEQALQPERGWGDEVADRNRLRMLLTTFFPRRECCTLPRPLAAESALSEMGAADAGHVRFREGFCAGLTRLRACLFQGLRPKCLHGSAMTGASLAVLLSEYVGAMNDGRVPTIARGWEAVQQAQSLKAVKSAIQGFKATMSVSDDGAALTYPTSPKVLRNRYDAAFTEAKRVLKACLLDPDGPSVQELVVKVQRSCDSVYELHRERNSAALQEQVRMILMDSWDSTHAKLLADEEHMSVAAVIAEWRALVRMVDTREDIGGQQETLTAVHAFCSETVLADILSAATNSNQLAEQMLSDAREAEQQAQHSARQAQEDAATQLQEAASASRATLDEIQRKLDSSLETVRAADNRAATAEQGRLNAVAVEESLKLQLEAATARAQAAETQVVALRNELSGMTKEAQEASLNVMTWQARCEKDAEISALKIQNAIGAADEAKARLTEVFAERAALQATVADEQRARRAAEQNAAAAERKVLETQLREERALRRLTELGGHSSNGADQSGWTSERAESAAASNMTRTQAANANLQVPMAQSRPLAGAGEDEVVTLPPRKGRGGRTVSTPSSDNGGSVRAPLPVRKRE